MKSNFVSSVSHELRAPIAAVRLMAESLEQGRISGEAKQREYFRLIVQECRRLSTLVENVLDFFRIDQGRKRYVFEPVDLIALVRHTVALMQPCAAEGKVALILEEPPAQAAGLEPSWDHQAVEQSLVNLLDNAIKHSPPGAEVKVRMETAAGLVRLWVEDRGPGIPAEAQTRIFDLFYRHGSELRRETKGAGIGLNIVKHVAEAHGGRVVVESAVGEGSRFALELPVNGGAK
jgi:signal transduction histidine kinase